MWQYAQSSELYHYGVKGMKWGVVKKDETSSRNTKKVNTEDSDKRGLTDKQKRAIAVGAVAVAGTLLVIGGMYAYKKSNMSIHIKNIRFGEIIDMSKLSTEDIVLQKGSKMKRMSSKSIEDYSEDGKRIYASFLKKDAAIYKEKMPSYYKSWANQAIIDNDWKPYEHVMKLKSEVKAPSKRTMAELYKKVEAVDVVDSGRYTKFMERLNNPDDIKTKQFFDLVKKSGYNALLDDNDAGAMTKSPLILLDPKSVIESSKSHKVGAIERVLNVAFNL